MKLNFKYIASAAVISAALSMTSCVKDLDVTPIDPSTNMEVNVPALFNKCYANMALPGQGGGNGDCDIDGLDGGTAGFVRQLWNANELTTDEAICCWGDDGISAFNTNSWGATHPMLAGFYYRLYAGIDYCNHYLSLPTCVEYDKTMTAEIKFLRALYYSYLLDCWGNVPFTTEISAAAPQQIKRADLYEKILEWLKECEPDMLEDAVRTSKDVGLYGRADVTAVHLLRARLYLNAEVYTGTPNWKGAYDEALEVINSKHKLWKTPVTDPDGYEWSAYQMLFMGDNGESGASCEAILPLLQDGQRSTSWGTSLFLLASTTKGDMTTTAGGSFGTSEAWAGNRARPEFVKLFFKGMDIPEGKTSAEMVDASGDTRCLIWGKDRTLDVESMTEFTSGYSVSKYLNVYSDGGTPHSTQFMDADYFLMRSAEAYLIAAEADGRLHGNTLGEGLKWLNEVRERAGVAKLPSATIYDVLDERGRELFYEGFRRTDLIRYGYFAGAKSGEYKWQWKGGVKAGVALPEHLNLFPLPYNDMNANPNLVQNPGY